MKASIRFITTRAFKRAARGVLGPGHLESVKAKLALNPELGDMIPGTGGARKLRQAGIRGHSRVIYYFHAGNGDIFLLTCFAKNQKPDLSRDEKKDLAAAIEIIKATTRH